MYCYEMSTFDPLVDAHLLESEYARLASCLNRVPENSYVNFVFSHDPDAVPDLVHSLPNPRGVRAGFLHQDRVDHLIETGAFYHPRMLMFFDMSNADQAEGSAFLDALSAERLISPLERSDLAGYIKLVMNDVSGRVVASSLEEPEKGDLPFFKQLCASNIHTDEKKVVVGEKIVKTLGVQRFVEGEAPLDLFRPFIQGISGLRGIHTVFSVSFRVPGQRKAATRLKSGIVLRETIANFFSGFVSREQDREHIKAINALDHVTENGLKLLDVDVKVVALSHNEAHLDSYLRDLKASFPRCGGVQLAEDDFCHLDGLKSCLPGYRPNLARCKRVTCENAAGMVSRYGAWQGSSKTLAQFHK